MDPLPLAAALVAARHDTREAAKVLHDALDESPSPIIELTGATLVLVSLLHTLGHASAKDTVVLDLFAAVPDTLAEREGSMIKMVRDAGSRTRAETKALFEDAVAGTSKDDRVWSTRTLPGGVHSVVLEGTGIPPRYIALVGGTEKEAAELTRDLNRLDGR